MGFKGAFIPQIDGLMIVNAELMFSDIKYVAHNTTSTQFSIVLFTGYPGTFSLTPIANDTLHPITSLKATALLYLNGDTTHYVEPIPNPQSSSSKRGQNSRATATSRPMQYTPSVRISPNPSSDLVFVNWFGIEWLEKLPSMTIAVMDVHGKEVYTLECEPEKSACSLHLGHLAAGVYSLQVWDGDRLLQTEKLILQP